MLSIQKLTHSIQPNFITFTEYDLLVKQSIAVQLDEEKKEELSDLHRDLIRTNLKVIIRSKSRKKH